MNDRISIVGGIALVVTLLVSGPGKAAAQGGVVGTAAKGTSAVEYIGVITQQGPQFSAVGYLTHVQGIDPADLFTNPAAPGAATARFTFSGNATLASHAQVGDVTQIGAVGTLTVYFNPFGGASFGDPGSFTAGQEIAAYDARFHNILAVIAPNLGVASATADAVQQSAQQFQLDGKRLRLGHPRLIQRLTLSGRGTRTQVEPPISETQFAASAVTP